MMQMQEKAQGTLRVFVVENHPDTLDSIQLYLSDLGHEVGTAMTLQRAEELLPAFRPDLLICDIGLPDGTGWELLERLRPCESMLCVAMSGFGRNADNARSREVGFRYHLLKPFRAAELDAIIAAAQAERSAREERE